jgi:hypothetical protein
MNRSSTLQSPVAKTGTAQSFYQDLITVLDGLLTDPIATGGWLRARVMLAALPLTNGEYVVSVNRLASAEEYIGVRKMDAARVELTALVRKLESLANTALADAEPQLR